MNITDEMVERAMRAAYTTFGPVYDRDDLDIEYTFERFRDERGLISNDDTNKLDWLDMENLVRAALAAALGDVELLEDVLGDAFMVTDVRRDRYGWYAEVAHSNGVDPSPERVGVIAHDIDAAIRDAVAKAKGERL